MHFWNRLAEESRAKVINNFMQNRTMIARNPFRINQRERTWLHRNGQPRVIDIARGVGQIDRQLYRLCSSEVGQE